MARVFVIDDDPLICGTFVDLLQREGHEVEFSLTLSKGADLVQQGGFDVVFLDVRLPDGDGLDLLPRLRTLADAPEVIIVTGYGDPDGAELAVKNGAWDYIEKDSIHRKIHLSLTRALQYRERNRAARAPVALKRGGIIGQAPAMNAAMDRLAQAAATEANVLITGETGTGKELFAQAIHRNSTRANRILVVVDCAALPETLTESVLFGHERGAFTGADRPRVGLIKQADQGTLFLDEVGELSLNLQKAFLRVLETGRFRPLGGSGEVKSTFRLVSATNRDLDGMVAQGQFRKDLLFRLRALTLDLPPLRDHKADIKELAGYYMAEICERHREANKNFAPEVFPALAAYDWPGNVRELIHTLEMTYAMARFDSLILPWHLPEQIRVQAARAEVGGGRCPVFSPGLAEVDETLLPTWTEFKEKSEAGYLEKLMSLCGWDIKKACRISGLSRTRIYELMKKFRISKTGRKPA